MEDASANCATFDETVVFLSYFNGLKGPRQQGKVAYPLPEILLLCLLAVLAGAETITDIALFGHKKLALLRRFRPFANGTPAHDHLGDILAVLDPEQFQRCFVAWVAALIGTPEGVISIELDGSDRPQPLGNRKQSALGSGHGLPRRRMRVRTDHAPANFCTIKHMAQNLIRRAPGKTSLRLKRKTAGCDDNFLASLIAQ